ncbi:caspase recruitment domain-containing protein 18-like [Mastacembelus armatus]|uniref:caspase recruitment domain-containing protein 18-like n=1 Tax=Mastacembelus armatus TaxID=205130 RepID=UPI000E455F18|nr:caspase recruitment domain-containing protein 18-like [Mastacembelus armatus]
MADRFVNEMTDVLINQLLDDLLNDGFLNTEQRDLVLAGNNTAQRAGLLFDTVTGRGNDAMERMISHLQPLNPELANFLQNRAQGN